MRVIRAVFIYLANRLAAGLLVRDAKAVKPAAKPNKCGFHLVENCSTNAVFKKMRLGKLPTANAGIMMRHVGDLQNAKGIKYDRNNHDYFAVRKEHLTVKHANKLLGASAKQRRFLVRVAG